MEHRIAQKGGKYEMKRMEQLAGRRKKVVRGEEDEIRLRQRESE